MRAPEGWWGVILLAVATFLSGALYESGCVFWVHFSEKGRPVATAVCSMLVAVAQVFGIGESVRDVRLAPFFVAGYGFGTWSAVAWKSRRTVSSKGVPDEVH